MKRVSLLLLLVPFLACSRPRPERKTTASPLDRAAQLEKTQVKTATLADSSSASDRLRQAAHSVLRPEAAALIRGLYGTSEQQLWGTLALGRHCVSLDAPAVSAALLVASSHWLAQAQPPAAELLNAAGWALGSCAQPDTEQILRPWLTTESQAVAAELVQAAVLGLAALVDRGGSLDERTQTLLLDVAQRERRADLLLPLGRLGRLSDAVGAQLLEVSATFLTQKDTKGRRQAIFALGSAGPSAASPLAQVLLGQQFTLPERTAAAQALGRLGEAGQEQLDQAVATLLGRGLPSRADQGLWVPLITALTTLTRVKASTPALRQLSSLPVPPAAKAQEQAQRRRVIGLRCRAAALLAGSAEQSRALLDCDPDRGRSFALAQLQVLSKGEINSARFSAYQVHLSSPDPVVSQAALRLLPSHPEVKTTPQILLAFLQSAQPGSRTLAAQLIHAYPAQALGSEENKWRPQLLDALKLNLENRELPQETRAACLLATGALGALNLKSLIEQSCHGNDPLLWEPAERALLLLGSKEAQCPATEPPQALSPSSSPKNAARPPVTLVVDSEVGELRLVIESQTAPCAAAHFLKQVDAGWYNQQRIILGRYGFTVQFGDQDEDGYDNTPAPGLPFEVSPAAFVPLTLGMSSFAPGAENTQVFVTVSDAPQLFGTRIALGRAEGPWELLVWGDELRTIKRLTK